MVRNGGYARTTSNGGKLEMYISLVRFLCSGRLTVKYLEQLWGGA